MQESTKIIEKNYNRTFLDEEIIRTLIHQVCEEESLTPFVHDVRIVNKFAGYLGSYFSSTKTLTINLSAIDRTHQRNIYYNEIPAWSPNALRQYNLLVLNVLFHELGHVSQTKESFSQKRDSLHFLIKEGAEFGMHFPHRLNPYEHLIYRLFYKDVLAERNAEFNALYTIIKRDEEAKFLSRREYVWLKNKLVSLMAHGYKHGTSPSQKYYALRLKSREYQQIPFIEDYTNEEILSWGMPAEDDLIEEIKRQKKEKEPNLELILR